MLARRIIPCLDVAEGRVVKGVQFIDLRDAGDPAELGERYSKEEADELVFLDITATSDNRKTMAHVVERVAERVSIPFTVGGGLRSVEDMRMMLQAGADKVTINTAAVADPTLIRRGADAFGSQCIVVAIDAKREGNSWKVYVKGGRERTEVDAVEWSRQAEEQGAGEILLTSMDRDGTKAGYDLELLRTISSGLGIPLIASGGAGSPAGVVEALTLGQADAILAASIFHYEEISIRELKEFLHSHGIVVRL
ncbi:MAG: imidazole glycerol phosphate synthase subunit HisF [Deltaproteobacteria bacterium]|nr:imidazole glycerol phosphate synthase subunit HisF [Deltaproteobacteria bacterium]